MGNNSSVKGKMRPKYILLLEMILCIIKQNDSNRNFEKFTRKLQLPSYACFFSGMTALV